jgi:hypothetical protein
MLRFPFEQLQTLTLLTEANSSDGTLGRSPSVLRAAAGDVEASAPAQRKPRMCLAQRLKEVTTAEVEVLCVVWCDCGVWSCADG